MQRRTAAGDASTSSPKKHSAPPHSLPPCTSDAFDEANAYIGTRASIFCKRLEAGGVNTQRKKNGLILFSIMFFLVALLAGSPLGGVAASLTEQAAEIFSVRGANIVDVAVEEQSERGARSDRLDSTSGVKHLAEHLAAQKAGATNAVESAEASRLVDEAEGKVHRAEEEVERGPTKEEADVEYDSSQSDNEWETLVQSGAKNVRV